MKVAVANLTSGGLSGGYRKYLERLMPLLAADSRVGRLTVYLPAGARVTIDASVDVAFWSPRDAMHGYAQLSSQLDAARPDVVFIPTARSARFGSIPVVTMVRNMEPLTVPFDGNTIKEGFTNLARAWIARRACRRATRVVAVSEHVRDFLIASFQIDPQRIGVVYHGVDLPAIPTAERRVNGDPVLFTGGS